DFFPDRFRTGCKGNPMFWFRKPFSVLFFFHRVLPAITGHWGTGSFLPAFVFLCGKEGGVLGIPDLINVFSFRKFAMRRLFFKGKEKKWAATYSPGCDSSTI
ncbi:hypothetical protein KI659_18555, partial [Litoribacter alkaliphilus]